MKTWYNLKKAEADKPGELSIFDDIGAYGVSAKNFLNDLRGIEADTVNLEINSPGGDLFAGLAIYNGLRASGKKINVKVLGLAASAASLVAMAGDTIEMPENTFMMVHKALTGTVANADGLREMAELLDKLDRGIVATYAKRTGKPEGEIAALLNAETWMTAQEAVDAGFATAVIPALSVQASFDVERLPENVRTAFKAQAPEDGVPSQASESPESPATEASPTLQATFAETFVEQVQAIANAAGLGQYAALWSADPALGKLDAVMTRASLAREVQALCVLAKMPDKADQFIKAALPLDDVRAQIFAALEQDYEHVDTAPPAKSAQNSGAQPSAGIKGADIWAARRQKTAK